MTPPAQPSDLHGLVKALEHALKDTPDRLVFVDGVPRAHPGDLGTAKSVLALVGPEYTTDKYRVYLENACDPEHSCEMSETPRILRNGYRFSTSPKDGNLGRGASPLPPPVAAEVRDLEADGLTIDVTDGNGHFLVRLRPVDLPPGLRGGDGSVMWLVPATYPRAAMDNFYLPVGVESASAVFKERANNIETHGGATWRRVSWHLTTAWPPGGMSFRSYLAWTREGLRRIAVS